MYSDTISRRYIIEHMISGGTARTLERISVADAPLVEGAVAAGVALSTGCSHAEAARAAEEARNVGKL